TIRHSRKDAPQPVPRERRPATCRWRETPQWGGFYTGLNFFTNFRFCLNHDSLDYLITMILSCLRILNFQTGDVAAQRLYTFTPV
ncbi:hypothetical protein KKF38_05165, partial [Patescibacteria group bacterium]|nr:hypothetical protein [Patescibacteria group bacterium]